MDSCKCCPMEPACHLLVEWKQVSAVTLMVTQVKGSHPEYGELVCITVGQRF